ncbi:MAG: GtrA family protein [Spirochaetes bacterium]|nr:GtrA family protein [Spirochaetota bacterium]
MIYLAVKYAIFAGIATVANIGTQYLTMHAYTGPFSLYAAMAAGTMVGLVIKYILDKRFIFYHQTDGARDDLFKFLVYTFMGVFTTAIFWGSELLFNHLFTFPEAKYLGAVVGLTIGYITKYNLDKRFVFRDWKLD